MKRTLVQKTNYISIPIQIGTEGTYLEIFDGPDKIFEFKVPDFDGEYDYIAKIRANDFVNHELTYIGDFSEEFFELIEKNLDEVVNNEKRPQIHFTAQYGWINDPNGLLYDGSLYHMYFQHNPFDIQWSNMSWGHATSTDLLHWQQHDDVMFPDANGTIFSGCGLIKDDEYLFPYTVAGTSAPWNDGKPFYQGLAVSYDGGMTLVKQEEPFLGKTGKDSRDPKIFWHEQSQAYIMVLYLEKFDFGIFRSKDLVNWEKTQHFSLEKDGGWECPDLLYVPCINGDDQWMFWCADGLYYWGDFDGYTFSSDFKVHHAYGNEALYATQSYFGIENRIVAVPWLRFSGRNGHCFQGAMGIPREYCCKRTDDDIVLLQTTIREYSDALKIVDAVPKEGCFQIEMDASDLELLDIDVNGSKLLIDAVNNTIKVDEKQDSVPIDFENIELLVDHNILEITVSNAIIFVYQIAGEANNFNVNWRNNGNTKRCGSQDGANCNYSIKSFK